MSRHTDYSTPSSFPPAPQSTLHTQAPLPHQLGIHPMPTWGTASIHLHPTAAGHRTRQRPHGTHTPQPHPENTQKASGCTAVQAARCIAQRV